MFGTSLTCQRTSRISETRTNIK